jgi:putative flavoprotein involved in K+ transport
VNEPVECTGTVVIGAGQAGLATSYELMQRGLDHVVLERGRAGEAWRNRWDSLCMILPNWFNCLPGLPYQGPEPDGFQTRDQWIANLDRYVSTFDLPVREGVSVDDVEQRDDGRFAVATSSGTFCADNVVVATGAYQAARLPDIATGIPLAIQQLHSGSYRNPAALPPGAVLVVGTGNSGSQIAEELSRSGRTVYLSVGYSGFPLRRYRGKDMYWWYVQAKLNQLFRFEGGTLRGLGNTTGCGGGRALDLRRFARDGVRLLGRIQSIDGAVVTLTDDLAESLAAIDRRTEAFRSAVDAYIDATGLDAPPDDAPSNNDEFAVPASPRSIDLRAAQVSAVIWATGYTWDLDWVRLPVLDSDGGPISAGAAGPCPGLYFAGMRVDLPNSTSIGHVGPEAARIAGFIAERNALAQ